MEVIKYPIKEVEINAIPGNRMLSLGITPAQKTLCEKSIRQYGLLTPIVLMENPTGEVMTLTGETELEVLKEMKVPKADVFITKLDNRSDAGKVILWLSSFQKGLNPLSEGLLLRQLLIAGGYNQVELAKVLLKSKSWVSKRLSLAQQLHDTVAEMVLSKKLCPGSAQEIARLPKELQHRFSMQVLSKGLPKSQVEKLVTAFHSKSSPRSLKEEIINNPVLALSAIPSVKFEKCKEKNEDKSDAKRLDSSIRLLLKLVTEVELNLSSMGKENLNQHHRILPTVETSLRQFLNFLEHCKVSPGKPETATGGGGDNANH